MLQLLSSAVGIVFLVSLFVTPSAKATETCPTLVRTGGGTHYPGELHRNWITFEECEPTSEQIAAVPNNRNYVIYSEAGKATLYVWRDEDGVVHATFFRAQN